MLRGFFDSGQRQRKRRSPDPFRTIFGTTWTIEYSGAIPALSNYGIRHRLFCAEINAKAAAALLEQGFRPINEGVPHYSIKCLFTLAGDKTKPRALFDIYLSLESIPASHWRQWIAVEVCKGLKKQLTTCQEKALLIRCRSSKEYPFCITDEELDIVWLDDADRAFRHAFAEYESIRQI